MFGNFRERFENVRHDVSQGWKSIADKAKSVNKKIVRKRTLITDEIIEGEDQCFSCDLEAGSEFLAKYQLDWADIHQTSALSALEAEKADQVISKAVKKTTELRDVMAIFHGELEKLPDVIKQVETIAADVDAIAGQADVLEGLLLELEEVCEKLDYERRKTGQRLKMIVLQQTKLDDLEKLKEDLVIEKAKNTKKQEQLERQESVEKQKVYEDAFIEQMNYYIQFGRTEEPISGHPEQSSSLADIKLEDDVTLDKQLDDFLGPEEQDGVDPSIPSKAPERSRHKHKKKSSNPKEHDDRNKPTESEPQEETINAPADATSSENAGDENMEGEQNDETPQQIESEPQEETINAPADATSSENAGDENMEGEQNDETPQQIGA